MHMIIGETVCATITLTVEAALSAATLNGLRPEGVLLE
jgi:hypothetical protein